MIAVQATMCGIYGVTVILLISSTTLVESKEKLRSVSVDPNGETTDAAVDNDDTSNYESTTDAFPGRITSPGEQCIDRHPQGVSGVCKTDDPASRCSELICADFLQFSRPVGYKAGPALDGTWCGDNKICLEGSCINDEHPPENLFEINDSQYDCKGWWGR